MDTAVFHAMTIPFTIRLRYLDPHRADYLDADSRNADSHSADSHRADSRTSSDDSGGCDRHTCRDCHASHNSRDIHGVTRTTAEAIERFMNHIDRVFSPFRSDSLTARANRGDWAGLRDNRDFYEVFALGAAARQRTRGHFLLMRHGRYDPVGLVKGWAIERAFERFINPMIDAGLVEAGVLGGGGDMQMGVAPDSDFTWRVGIDHPTEPGMLAGTVELANGGIATSGYSKRGQHIEHTGPHASNGLIQATVAAEHLTDADMLATTALSAGLAEFRALTSPSSPPAPRQQSSSQSLKPSLLFNALLIGADGSRLSLKGSPCSAN